MRAIVIFTTMPDENQANELGHLLVDKGLAACVQVSARCRSIYKWQGKVESADEVLLTIKALPEQVAAIQAILHEFHPYETPEFLVLSATASASYSDWMQKELNVRNQ